MAKHVGLDLLETFVTLVDCGGDASAAGQRLGVSQPTMSKRLSALREETSEPDGQPWLILKGKRWLLTEEGDRVFAIVADLVRRYEHVEQFINRSRTDSLAVSVACGQLAAMGILRRAVEGFVRDLPDCRVRLSTPRGRLRIEGVAAGQFDLAVVTDRETTIRDVAGIELYVQSLCSDQFMVAANPAARANWAPKWESLPVRRPLKAEELVDLPLILPEPDASRRRQFDEWYFRHTQRAPNVKIESGGWLTILQFAAAGIGVGFATQTALDAYQQTAKSRSGRLAERARRLDTTEFVPDQVRLVARKIQGRDEPDLAPQAQHLWELIVAAGNR